jgi:putative protease
MEIVAPAGDYNRFLASVKAGGDAIYLGLKGIGARRKAPNFTLDELREAIDYAHLRGVRVYLTLNTIYKDLEIESLYENLKALYNHGIDAFIIQDLGMAKFLKDNL